MTIHIESFIEKLHRKVEDVQLREHRAIRLERARPNGFPYDARIR